MGTAYASGNWIVMSGREEEFVQRWTEFLDWTRSSFESMRSAHLIRDAENSRHFVSFASWDSAEALLGWRSRPEFADRFSACRALCDDFRGSSYTVAAVV